MSTASDRRVLAEDTIAFVKAFDSWVRRASVAQAGESVPRLQLLNELYCNGPRKMADLADTLGVTPRAVTALVDGLEAEQLVTRTAHSTDRRVTMVEIQPRGTATVEQGMGPFQAAVDELFSGLDETEAQSLRRALELLRERMASDVERSQVAGSPGS